MVVVRNVLRRDLDEVRRFATTAVVYVDDVTDEDGNRCSDKSITDSPLARVAEDDCGILGYARTLLRPQIDRVEADLTTLLVAPHARDWAIDRLLVSDARREAAAHGATHMSVLVRPPVDAFFRGLGGQALGIIGSWNGPAAPRIHLDLLCSQ